MKNVKMPTSDSYREFLIECLKDPEHAAGYIEAILEEKDPEPELLRNALRRLSRLMSQVISCQSQLNSTMRNLTTY